MAEIDLTRTWSHRLSPLFWKIWYEARREILFASRMEMDDNIWMTSPSGHMGDPAKKVDQVIHQFADSGLRELVAGIQVFGEEASLDNLVLRKPDYRYLGYLDAIDGSAQAWSLPGAWGHVLVIQEFTGGGSNQPQCEVRFVGVLDAEGGVTMAEEGLDFVSVEMIDRLDREAFSDDWLTYSGETFEVTSRPVVLVGGYKPTWWERFSAIRTRVCQRWPGSSEAPGPAVFNTAGSPVTRKVIQNADNVAVQFTPSTLWDGVAAALVSRAGGYVIRIGEVDPVPRAEVWDWWSQFGYLREGVADPWKPAMVIPPFVVGMDGERVRAVAEICRELPKPDPDSPCHSRN